jgi:outer membrane protein OmpA-like peptidoglycan-associated protein
VLLLAMLLAGSPAQAREFGAGLDATVWNLDPAPLHCRLWQPVASFGTAGFETLAGHDMVFYLEALRPFPSPGTAQLKIAAPFWRPGVREQTLGEIATVIGKRPLQVGAEWANRFLDELASGMSPAFALPGWSSGGPVAIAISAVDFGQAYEGYVSCLSALFPASFEQLRYTTLQYNTNFYGLSAADKKRLDLIAGYTGLDPSVTRIVVHAHTDNEGRKGHNWELSRLRGQTVVDYLKKRGVAESLLTMHYWGRTRPLVANTSKANKAKNRRTYIQMDRAEP